MQHRTVARPPPAPIDTEAPDTGRGRLVTQSQKSRGKLFLSAARPPGDLPLRPWRDPALRKRTSEMAGIIAHKSECTGIAGSKAGKAGCRRAHVVNQSAGDRPSL